MSGRVNLNAEAANVREAMEQIQSAGNNLAARLEDYTKAGGDPHATVQALELFIRAVIRDCVTRLELIPSFSELTDKSRVDRFGR